MQDSTSGRRSQGTRKEILPHRAWRFSEHPAGKQVTLYAAKSFTSRCRRIVHSRPKNKAATLFKPEVQGTQLRWTADMTPEGPTVPILRRREKQWPHDSAPDSGSDGRAAPGNSKGQEPTGKGSRTLRQDIGALMDREQWTRAAWHSRTRKPGCSASAASGAQG